MDRNYLALEVRVNGRKLREYQHEGQIWVEGRKNSDFKIRLRNDGFCRVMAVPSIDGLSVMDGEPASYTSGGYIIDPRGHIDVPGWHLDDDRIAKFRFGNEKQSHHVIPEGLNGQRLTIRRHPHRIRHQLVHYPEPEGIDLGVVIPKADICGCKCDGFQCI